MTEMGGKHRLHDEDDDSGWEAEDSGLDLVEQAMVEHQRRDHGLHRVEAIKVSHAAWWRTHLSTAVVAMKGRHRAGRGTSRGA